MESVKRLVSSRLSTRQILTTTNRPLTSLPSSTGLIMPKYSRGRTTVSVRRQIQDKSYWLSVLSEKMDEIQLEINCLNRNSEMMKKNESKINIMEQNAISLAKELKEKSIELDACSEYFERIRFNEKIEDVEKEIELVRQDNEKLTLDLEKKYEEKKKEEKNLTNLEIKLQQKQKSWSDLLMKFDVEQQKRYNELDEKIKNLNKVCESQEKKIIELKKSIQQLEQNKINSENNLLLEKEILFNLERLHKLETQQEELLEELNEEENQTNKKYKLLAQLKHNNRELNNLDKEKQLLEENIKKTELNLNEYKNLDEREKYEMIVAEEVNLDKFLNKFDFNLKNEKDKLNQTKNELKEIYFKCLQFIEKINFFNELENNTLNNEISLIEKKLKLQLDLARLEKIQQKTNEEMDLINNQLENFENNLINYTKTDELKFNAKVKLEKLNEEKLNLEQDLNQLIDKETIKNKEYVKLKHEFENENPTYYKLVQLESKLANLVEKNFIISSEIYPFDYQHLKIKALEEIDKYNEKLLGF